LTKLPKVSTRTDAYVKRGCGGTMSIATVAPVVGRPDIMRHSYICLDCGKEATFDVAKKRKSRARRRAGPLCSRQPASPVFLLFPVPPELGFSRVRH